MSLTTPTAATTNRAGKSLPRLPADGEPGPPLAEAAEIVDEELSLLLAEATTDVVRDWKVVTNELHWPQGLETLLDYAPSVVTNEIGFWQRHLHADDRARTAASICEALAAATTTHWSGEYRFRKRDGSYALLLERAVIVRDAAGAAVRWVGSLMDITARQQLQDQLCRSQRMEAFGQLATGVAHDFNNFLTTILGYSDLLLGDKAVKAPVAEHISEIRSAAKRASTLAAQLLAFGRRHPLDPCVLEVNTLITNLERSLLRLVGENITIECDLHAGEESAHIRADRGQVAQIILNLAVNARDAMPQGGHLYLTTGVVQLNGNAPEPLTPGEYVTVSVRDNGCGMTPEVKARAFEPFFTTKDVGQGSGLGLATSYGIIRQSGGDIRVESEPGQGTTFTIFIPRAPAPKVTYQLPRDRNLPRGTETVLVVEDDIGVRHLAVRVLRSLGYRVIEAASGDDAQRLIAGQAENAIDLLLTDIVMPHMSGHHFAEWLSKVSPKTKVLFISGYLEESVNRAAASGAAVQFLPKPFDPPQLALKVRQTLDC